MCTRGSSQGQGHHALTDCERFRRRVGVDPPRLPVPDPANIDPHLFEKPRIAGRRRQEVHLDGPLTPSVAHALLKLVMLRA